MTDGEVPVTVIWKHQRRLNDAIEEGAWEECVQLANAVCVQIRLALNPATSQTGKVHLDGVFSVGTMRYGRAPAKVKRALDKMNRIIKTAKGTIR